MSNMDPFDEFEFKPLTEGLGFHKKAVSLKDGLKESGVLDDELLEIPTAAPTSTRETAVLKRNHSFDDVLSALEKAPLQRTVDLEFTETLPREPEAKPPVQSPFPRKEAFRGPAAPAPTVAPTATAKADLNKVGTRRGAADQPGRRLKPATMSLPSAFLDLVIVIALALVFLVSLLTVTKVDLNVVLRNLSNDLMTQISLGVMFVTVMQMYVVISRSFFGRTLGEWTFDLQVGQDVEQGRQSYPFRVVLRSLLVTATGLVLLPLLSALLRRDIAGGVSGAKLYRAG